MEIIRFMLTLSMAMSVVFMLYKYGLYCIVHKAF